MIAANALSHVADVHAVVGGIKRLLAPGGTCVIEDPYWGDVVSQTAFDQIYDEHAWYFTLSSVQHLFGSHGLDVVDVEPTDVHGGSMRYWIGHSGSRPPTGRVAELLDRERVTGLHRFETLHAFRERVSVAGEQLMKLLHSTGHSRNASSDMAPRQRAARRSISSASPLT